jgi:transposase
VCRSPLTLRRDRLDKAITEMAHEPEWAPVVTRLPCLRGVSTLTAFALAVEIGDWERFTGSSIGAYLGLVPTENSSGERRSQGSITKAGTCTKAGNMHARRLLVEAAWHHRSASSAALRARWDIASRDPFPVRVQARPHGRGDAGAVEWTRRLTDPRRPSSRPGRSTSASPTPAT